MDAYFKQPKTLPELFNIVALLTLGLFVSGFVIVFLWFTAEFIFVFCLHRGNPGYYHKPYKYFPRLKKGKTEKSNNSS